VRVRVRSIPCFLPLVHAVCFPFVFPAYHPLCRHYSTLLPSVCSAWTRFFDLFTLYFWAPAYACITTLPIILRPNVALLTFSPSLSHTHKPPRTYRHTFRRVIDVLRNRFPTIDWYEFYGMRENATPSTHPKHRIPFRRLGAGQS